MKEAENTGAEQGVPGLLGALLKFVPSRWRGKVTKVLQDKVYSGSAKYLLAAIYIKAINIVLLPVWVHFLTPEHFGVVGVVTAYAGVLVPLMCLGLPSAVVRSYFDDGGGDENWRRYYSSVLIFLVAAVTLILVALGLHGESLWLRVTTGEIPFYPFAMIIVALVFAGCLGRINNACFKAHQEHGFLTALSVGGATVTALSGLVLVVGFKWNALGMLIAQLAGAGSVALIIAVFAIKRWFIPAFSFAEVKRALKFGLPLVPHALALVVLQMTDRIMLEKMSGLEQVGLYTVAAKLVLVVNMLVHSMGNAWTPRFYELMNEGGEVAPIRTYFARWQIVIGSLVVVTILVGAEVLALLIPSTYDPAIILIGPLVCGAYFFGLYQFGGGYLFFRKRTRTVAVLSTSLTVLNIVLNLVLIPHYDALGAAFATFISYGVMMVAYQLAAGGELRRCLSWGITLPGLVACLLAVTASLLLPNCGWGPLLTKTALAAVIVGGLVLVQRRQVAALEQASS